MPLEETIALLGMPRNAPMVVACARWPNPLRETRRTATTRAPASLEERKRNVRAQHATGNPCRRHRTRAGRPDAQQSTTTQPTKQMQHAAAPLHKQKTLCLLTPSRPRIGAYVFMLQRWL